jgi:spermidine/putrescine transport system substrate-binding protein
MSVVIFWLICFILFLVVPSVINLTQNDKTINVFTWTATLDPKIAADFEKETGIHVNFVYFENNEELFVKLLTTKGKGYDLIMSSDYTIQNFIKYDLLKPLDKSKINFWQRINPRLLNCYFDPDNTYTIPYFWAVYGLGVNREFFGNQELPHSWSLLFDYPLNHAKVAMFNVAREAMLVAAQYFYGTIENITQEKVAAIEQKLIEQKQRVETYTDADLRVNYLLASETVPVSIAATPYIVELMQEDASIDFIFPKEGSFILIDALSLSSATKKDAMVYEFINYLFRPEILLHHFLNVPFFPTTRDAKALMQEYNIPRSIIDAHFNTELTLNFFKNIIPHDVANRVWMNVKTS